jgi:hypothetical protein
VVVPDNALVVLPNGETVVFVIEGENAVRRRVKVAMEAGGAVAVESGIQAGELVITRGNDALKDGAPVQVMGQKKNAGGAPGDAARAPNPGKPEGAGKDRPAR